MQSMQLAHDLAHKCQMLDAKFQSPKPEHRAGEDRPLHGLPVYVN